MYMLSIIVAMKQYLAKPPIIIYLGACRAEAKIFL
jgi:hypothetical protein